MPGPVVSLLPARNAAADLPDHLDSVARFADVVVALDDGSTDDTRAILEAHPLVHTVLTNPRRPSYAGWDDAENRNRLLAAAQALSPAWIMSLDADELLADDDGAAFRSFLLDGADPDDAYLFRVFRMIGDLDHHDGSELWVGRLFAPRAGHVFPSDRLHFVPLPTAIDRERWRPTTFRIQHRGSLTEVERRARFAKYREADPTREWQGSYAHLLRAPTQLRTWYPRGALLPPIAHEPLVDPSAPSPDQPAFSVVVLAGRDGSDGADRPGGTGPEPGGVRRVLDAVLAQDLDEPFEVVVVAPGPAAAELRRSHPDVIVLPTAPGGTIGAAANVGIRAAEGRHVLFLDDFTVLDPGHLAARLTAHRQGWPVVSGAVRNGTRTPWGWAAHFLDRSAVQPARPSGAYEVPPATQCSFRCELLEEVGGFDERLSAAFEAVAAAELFVRGYGAHHERQAAATWVGPGRGAGAVVVEQFRSGRTAGLVTSRSRDEGALTTRRLVRNLARSLPGRLRRIHDQVGRWGGADRRRYHLVLPLVVVGAAAGWAGAGYEVLRQSVVGSSRPRLRRTRSR